MSEMTPTPEFEEEVRAAVATPIAREEFIKSLHSRIVHQAETNPRLTRPVYLQPAWVIVFIITALLIGILAIGPQRVIAAVQGLFGYIPGIGFVDQGTSIRVLAEPVTVTRDEISITVTSATLAGDKTHIEYRIFGVPGSAYPNREDVIGCTTPEYLRLPDGRLLTRKDNDFEPIPTEIDAATFVIPCIFNTLPGKTPENWELPLHFIPAPPDFTVMLVTVLSPPPSISQTPGKMELPENASSAPESTVVNTPAVVVSNVVTVSKVIETSDGYILVGLFQPQGGSRELVQQTGALEIRDATGKIVPYTIPQDIQLGVGNPDQGVYSWVVQFKGAGLAYPLTISFPSVNIIHADPTATAEFTIDVGENPQPGQEWTPNTEIQLAGHTLKLEWIDVDSRNGYSLMFHGDPKVYNADLQIIGYTPSGWGGSGLTGGEFNVGLNFAQLPSGVLKVKLSNLATLGDPINWKGYWSPEKPRTDLPINPTLKPGLCLTSDNLTQIKLITSPSTNGKILVYEKLEDTGTWGLVIYSLDGSQRQIVVSNGNWGSLSPDGSKVAYSASDNEIHLVDVNFMTEQVIQNASGFNIQWSPDGTKLAYIGMGNGAVDSAFIANTDDSLVQQLSSLSYETIIGWSPEGAQLYFAAPYTGGAAWKVYSYDIASGSAQERFTIENGTPMFLNPKLSTDGNWIAYRGKDNSSLYLVHPDGSDMHLVLDNVGVVGIEWSSAGWLGVSLSDPSSTESTIVLVKPDNCEGYKLPFTVNGDLEGLFIP
jgi:hypothetical protein